MFSRILNVKWLAIVLVGLILASVGYSLAAGNTLPSSQAGDGSGAIQDYSVDNVHFSYNVNNPQIISSVSFTLSAGARTVRMRLNSGSTWYDCTLSGGTSVTCPINPGINWGTWLASMTVVAVQ